MREEIVVMPFLSQAEHLGKTKLPPRLAYHDILSKAQHIAWMASPPEMAVQMKARAERRSRNLDFIQWPDGTRVAVELPPRFCAIPIDKAKSVYEIARRARERVVFERFQGGTV